MPDRYVGHRGADGGWSWEPVEGPTPGRGSRPPRIPTPLLGIAALFLLVAGIATLVILVVGSDDESVTVTQTPSAPPRTTPASPTAVPSMSPPETMALYAWDPEQAAWRSGEVTLATAGGVPNAQVFLLQVAHAEPGRTYQAYLSLSGCRAGSGPLDSPVSPIFAANSAFVVAPGPGRTRPDSLASIPADGGGDDGGDGEIAAWGAVIQDLAWANSLDICAQSPLLRLDIAAKTETLSLIWATRIAANPSGFGPLTVPVAISGVGEEAIQLLSSGGVSALPNRSALPISP